MPRRITIKDHLRETQIFNQRVAVAVAMIAVLVVVALGRLIYLQVIGHEHFTTLSKNNRVKIVPLPPARGLIFDRNGVVLAENLPSFSLEIIPEQIENMESTIQELQKLIEIRPTDISRFYRLLKRKRRFEGVPLRFRLNEIEVASLSVNQHRLQGVEILARLARSYPLGELAAHAVGYVGRIDEMDLQKIDTSNYSGTTHIGKVGVERSYEDILHGKVGYQQVETNAQGRLLRVLNRALPLPGNNLILSLDAKLQRLAQKALEGERGAVVAISPDNGDLLALVSSPAFDPNPFVNGIEPAVYEKLQQSGDKPLFNRALLGQYPPGSTIKPFIGLAGLEYGVIDPTTTKFCPGWYKLKGDDRKYRDWKRGGHGNVNLDSAITQSCDVYFYDLAYQLGIDRFHDFLQRFGFGSRTGIDIYGELPGLLPSREWKRRSRQLPWYPGETLITGIGQGFTLVTPLQLAATTAIIAKRGKRLIPRIVKAVANQASGQTREVAPRETTPVTLLSATNWDMIIRAMTNVVHGTRGTARAIGRGAQYRIAGKTGTAQVYGIKQDEEYDKETVAKQLRDHSVFIAFAPAHSVRIAIAVVVENAGSGSSVAAPIARRILDAYLTGQNP